MNDLKALLMPVYTRGNEIERLRGALSLACYFGAHLEVLHAQTKPSDLLEAGPFDLSNDARKRMIAIMDEDVINEQRNLQDHFRALCEQYNVSISGNEKIAGPSASWTEIEGVRSELVAQRGRVNDLIIIPRSVDGAPTLTFEAAMLHTGRPVLMVPRGMFQFTAKRIMIGWSGSLEGARAIQHALPFMQRAQSVLIVSSKKVAEEQPDGNDVQRFLGLHGIESEFAVIDDPTKSTGEALLDKASEQDCDLLVTGGYTHTRLHQRILGGVTNDMLKLAGIPVLMAH